MQVLLIIFSSIFSVVVIFFMIATIKIRNRKKKISDWKVGDRLILSNLNLRNILDHHGREYAILLGVSLNEVVVTLDGRGSRIIEHSDVECNKSAYWRRIENRCADQMPGQNLGFNSNITEVKEKINKAVKDLGKDLAVMNETELRVHLQNAITEENYELAEAIKKELERFR